jgi:hypothetical protein
MTLEYVHQFGDELLDSTSRLYRSLPVEDRTAFNDPYLLQACWSEWQRHAKTYGLVQRDGTEVVGAAFFRLQPTRLAGRTRPCLVPLVYGASDFTPFIAREDVRREFWTELIEHLKAAPHDALLPRLRDRDTTLVPRESMRFIPYSQDTNPICWDRDGAFSKITRKESLRYCTNWFKRQGRFTVTHRERGVAPDTMELFFKMHRARWEPLGITSKFTEPAIAAVYRRLCAGFGDIDRPSSSTVFTEICLDDRPVAMHIGFRWAETFLYQVPVVDTTMLKHSPGMVLLKSLFEYAIDEGLSCFDMGFGNESYKSRFASETLLYRTYVIARSTLSAAGIRIRRSAAELARNARPSHRASVE